MPKSKSKSSISTRLAAEPWMRNLAAQRLSRWAPITAATCMWPDDLDPNPVRSTRSTLGESQEFFEGLLVEFLLDLEGGLTKPVAADRVARIVDGVARLPHVFPISLLSRAAISVAGHLRCRMLMESSDIAPWLQREVFAAQMLAALDPMIATIRLGLVEPGTPARVFWSTLSAKAATAFLARPLDSQDIPQSVDAPRNHDLAAARCATWLPRWSAVGFLAGDLSAGIPPHRAPARGRFWAEDAVLSLLDTRPSDPWGAPQDDFEAIIRLLEEGLPRRSSVREMYESLRAGFDLIRESWTVMPELSTVPDTKLRIAYAMCRLLDPVLLLWRVAGVASA